MKVEMEAIEDSSVDIKPFDPAVAFSCTKLLATRLTQSKSKKSRIGSVKALCLLKKTLETQKCASNLTLQSLAEWRIRNEYVKLLKENGTASFSYNFVLPPVFPTVLNVVASAGIPFKLDLKKVSDKCKNVEFNPCRFASCVMRITVPKSTCLVFKSGKLIVSGCKSESDSLIAVRRFVRILQKNVEPRIRRLASYTIQNMSAKCRLPFAIDLRKMTEFANPKDDPDNNSISKRTNSLVSYEPELFPGLVWRLKIPELRVVIFSTGAMLFTGAKSAEQLNEAMKQLYPICRYCRNIK